MIESQALVSSGNKCKYINLRRLSSRNNNDYLNCSTLFKPSSTYKLSVDGEAGTLFDYPRNRPLYEKT
jgi:hypothetical protein